MRSIEHVYRIRIARRKFKTRTCEKLKNYRIFWSMWYDAKKKDSSIEIHMLIAIKMLTSSFFTFSSIRFPIVNSNEQLNWTALSLTQTKTLVWHSKNTKKSKNFPPLLAYFQIIPRKNRKIRMKFKKSHGLLKFSQKISVSNAKKTSSVYVWSRPISSTFWIRMKHELQLECTVGILLLIVVRRYTRFAKGNWNEGDCLAFKRDATRRKAMRTDQKRIEWCIHTAWGLKSCEHALILIECVGNGMPPFWKWSMANVHKQQVMRQNKGSWSSVYSISFYTDIVVSICFQKFRNWI